MFGLFKRKSNRRLADRHETPVLEVVFDGDAFETADWNLSGCRLAGYRGKRKRNDKITINTLDGERMDPCYVSIAATVVRRSLERRELVLHFDDLGSTARQYLKQLQDTGPGGGRRIGGAKGFGNKR